MAGAGVKLFLSGEIAYAADINQYLMDQSVCRFLNVTERNAAFGSGTPVSQGGDGKPALAPGRMCFLLEGPGSVPGAPVRTVQYYDGSAWQDSDQFTIPDGFVTSDKIANDSIMNVDINSAAAIVDTKLATISTAGKVSNSATTAASANTASAIVARDASGNFSAGTITASLTGTATNASKIGNRTVFVQNATPTALATGDIWFQVAGL